MGRGASIDAWGEESVRERTTLDAAIAVWSILTVTGTSESGRPWPRCGKERRRGWEKVRMEPGKGKI